jgi:hypothetical protein
LTSNNERLITLAILEDAQVGDLFDQVAGLRFAIMPIPNKSPPVPMRATGRPFTVTVARATRWITHLIRNRLPT